MKNVRLREIRHHWEVYLFILPTIALIALFQYYPAASGIFHSFFRWNGSDIAEFIGLDNYLDLARTEAFWNSFKVALVLGAWNIFKMIPALLVAVCIHRCRSLRLQFLYRTLFVIPMVIPGLVVALIWRSFFLEATAGYLNKFLYATHLFDLLVWLDAHLFHWGVFVAGAAPAWLGDPRLILTAIIVWGFPWVGSFAVLTHLAKLQNIDKALYEAADIDGVGWWSKFTQIELPMIMGSIYLLLVFVVIDTVKDAGMILALAGLEGGPGGAVTVPALFMLRKAFLEQQMGYACAVGIVLTLVVLGLQKLSAVLLNWRDLRAGQKRSFRIVMLALAGGLLASGRFLPLAALMILGVLPYGALLAPLARAWEKRAAARERGAEDVAAFYKKRARRDAWREQSAPYQRGRAAGGLLLRGAKHATIWLVLALALLPLYLMLIVSGKTNAQFYESPAALTEPFHWENWAVAWRLITPALANTMVVAGTATLCTLFLALGGAYFFARVRMPGSVFLWNAILLLMMIPAIANLMPLFTLLQRLNLLNTLTALILVGTSGGLVFGIFVLRNFVADIPHDLFEAAEIDGASHFRQMMMIVVPLSGPILGTVGVMLFLHEWNDFVLPLIIIRDQDRLPVMVQLYRLVGEYIKNWGPLMAGYAMASLPVIILFIFSMKLFIRGLTEGATKG